MEAVLAQLFADIQAAITGSDSAAQEAAKGEESMSESLEELERLARRLCEVAGWELCPIISEDGWIEVVNSDFQQIPLSDWLPLARVVEERDRLGKLMAAIQLIANSVTNMTELERADIIRVLSSSKEGKP